MGAALATLLSYIVMASGYYIVTQKFYKINYDYLKIAKITLAVTFVGTVSVSYTHLTMPTSDLGEISVVAVSLKKKKTWSTSVTTL